MWVLLELIQSYWVCGVATVIWRTSIDVAFWCLPQTLSNPNALGPITLTLIGAILRARLTLTNTTTPALFITYLPPQQSDHLQMSQSKRCREHERYY